jgi:hypothetical protein
MIGEIILQIQGDDQYELAERITKYEKIFRILIEKGALDGVKGGSSNIHFDGDGLFQGVQLNYWPYKEGRVSRGLER